MTGIAGDIVALEAGRELAGTLAFMAPELLDHAPAYSVQSDLYALGMALLWLVLGRSPIPSGAALGSWIRFGQRPSVERECPDLDPSLASLIERLIVTDPAARPQSAAEALAALGPAARRRASCPIDGARMIGPWVLGEPIGEPQIDWTTHVATHVQTGMPARFSETTAEGWLDHVGTQILKTAERASRMHIDGVLSLLDCGPIRQGAYVVTPTHGLTLAEYVSSVGTCDELEVLDFGAKLADALAHLHADGHVYQVVAPDKVVLSSDARSAILAWPVHFVPIGRIKLGEGGVSVPRHAPPEALHGPEPHERTTALDLFGLGSTLLYALAGETDAQKRAYDDAWEATARGRQQGINYPEQAFEEIALLKSSESIRALSTRAPQVTRPTVSMIAQLLAPEPGARGTASAAAARFRQIASHLRS